MTLTFRFLLVLLLHMIGGVPIDVEQPNFVVGPFNSYGDHTIIYDFVSPKG
jgi:hypothetical protein